jgi:hypothetical protein
MSNLTSCTAHNNLTFKCPRPAHYHPLEHLSQMGSARSRNMQYSAQIQQNKKRGKTEFLPVPQKTPMPRKN